MSRRLIVRPEAEADITEAAVTTKNPVHSVSIEVAISAA